MGHYGSSTPKRHYAYSNSSSILKIDKGVLQGWKRKGKNKVATAKHYVDSSGRKRYQGTSQLRSTETLDFSLRHFVTMLRIENPVITRVDMPIHESFLAKYTITTTYDI